jgi:transposase
VPGVERQPLKKLGVDESALLKLLHRWREEAEKAGHRIKRVAVAFEAGRDGFWLARWLRARGIEAHVIHASSPAVSREHRRAKTDRLDTELLKRAFLGSEHTGFDDAVEKVPAGERALDMARSWNSYQFFGHRSFSFPRNRSSARHGLCGCL